MIDVSTLVVKDSRSVLRELEIFRSALPDIGWRNRAGIKALELMEYARGTTTTGSGTGRFHTPVWVISLYKNFTCNRGNRNDTDTPMTESPSPHTGFTGRSLPIVRFPVGAGNPSGRPYHNEVNCTPRYSGVPADFIEPARPLQLGTKRVLLRLISAEGYDNTSEHRLKSTHGTALYIGKSPRPSGALTSETGGSSLGCTQPRDFASLSCFVTRLAMSV